jgi:hypothetical protein
VVTGAFLTII